MVLSRQRVRARTWLCSRHQSLLRKFSVPTLTHKGKARTRIGNTFPISAIVGKVKLEVYGSHTADLIPLKRISFLAAARLKGFEHMPTFWTPVVYFYGISPIKRRFSTQTHSQTYTTELVDML